MRRARARGSEPNEDARRFLRPARSTRPRWRYHAYSPGIRQRTAAALQIPAPGGLRGCAAQDRHGEDRSASPEGAAAELSYVIARRRARKAFAGPVHRTTEVL